MGVFVISLKTFSEQKTFFSNLKLKLDDFFFLNKTQSDKKTHRLSILCCISTSSSTIFFFFFLSMEKKNKEKKQKKTQKQKQATVLALLVTVPSIGESGSVLSPKSSPLMEFDEDDLTQLAEGEFYATPRHVGRVQGGIANYVLQQHRLETRRKTGKNITFEEKDQAVVLSAVGRWKHPGLQAAANDLAKDMGFLVEEADRFATWSILKRLERGETLPALYADEEFLRGGDLSHPEA